jgi:hypothetical protein
MGLPQKSLPFPFPQEIGIVRLWDSQLRMPCYSIPSATYLFSEHPSRRIVRLALLNIAGVVMQSQTNPSQGDYMESQSCPRIHPCSSSAHPSSPLSSNCSEYRNEIQENQVLYTRRRRKCRFICRCASLWISFLANVASLMAAFCTTDGVASNVAFATGISSNAAGWTFAVLGAGRRLPF